jgi:hypothetical protein
MTRLMLAIESKRQKGVDGATSSRGLRSLLRSHILLDFSGFYSLIILSIKHKIKHLTDTQLRRIILLRGHSLLNHLTPPTKGLLCFLVGDQKRRQCLCIDFLSCVRSFS